MTSDMNAIVHWNSEEELLERYISKGMTEADSLRGLVGVYILVSDLPPDVERRGLLGTGAPDSEKIRNHIKSQIDTFVNAYLSVNPEVRKRDANKEAG